MMKLMDKGSAVAEVRGSNYELPEFIIRDEEFGGRPVVAQSFEAQALETVESSDGVLKQICEASIGLDAAEAAIIQITLNAASAAGFGSLLEALANYSANR